MKNHLIIILILLFTSLLSGQKTLENTLEKLNKESVPYAYVDELIVSKDITILDTRKKEEFDVSHIKESVWVGYESFALESFLKNYPDKNEPILVYCSIGVRSEDIGEQLQKVGYTNVKNLYGGIFEWKNQGLDVYNNSQVETDSVHAFDKFWGKLLHDGIKVYNKQP